MELWLFPGFLTQEVDVEVEVLLCDWTAAVEPPGMGRGDWLDFSVTLLGVKQRFEWAKEEVEGAPSDVAWTEDRGALVRGATAWLLSEGVDEQRTLKVIPHSSSSSSSSSLPFSAVPFSRTEISLCSSPSSSSSMSESRNMAS